MRGFARMAAVALAGASMGTIARMAPSGGPIILGGNRHRHVEGPGGKRVATKTRRGREAGMRGDPFFGIASKGRRGAGGRMRAMEDARWNLERRKDAGRAKRSNPFKDETRKGVYVRAIKGLAETSRDPVFIRNEAMKIARRFK